MYGCGVPNNIIADKGTQFTAREFIDFCVDSGIKKTMPQCHTRRVVAKWSTRMA
jgi:hypothetical protein